MFLYTDDCTKLIGFTGNANGKLSKRVFTTLRICNPAKYYLGNILEIRCNEFKSFDAKIIKIETVKIKDIDDQSHLDDDSSLKHFHQRTIKNYGKNVMNMPVSILTFRKQSIIFYLKEVELK